MTTDLARTHYPDVIVARALELAAGGHSIRRIESDLAREFPDTATPSRDTVRRWALSYADSSREEEGDRVQRIITLADDAVVAGLNGARESDNPEKYIIPANAVAGTYRDKRDRVAQPPEQRQPFAIIIQLDPSSAPSNDVKPDDDTEIIEGTAREVGE